jgi:hypothetical protein
MLNALLNGLVKSSLYMILWVFILSISWNGRTLFDRAHDVLVDNAVVHAIDHMAMDAWDAIQVRLAIALNQSKDSLPPDSDSF